LTKQTINSLDRAGFDSVLDDIRIHSIDVGSRGGFMGDLLPIARCVDLVGFEPDPDELDRLKRSTNALPWARARYLHYALGRTAETASLNIYSHSGNSSLYRANDRLIESFGRADYFKLVNTTAVEVDTLDSVLAKENMPSPHHIKMDVQGWELEILKGASRALESTLAARLEISFMALYEDQPLFADVDRFMREKGFVLMNFAEVHAWRRTTRRKWPRRARGPYPYSRGQLAHGDALYFRAPEEMPECSPEALDAKIRLGLLACAYEHIDHAVATLTSPALTAFGREKYGIDFAAAVSKHSRRLARIPAFYRRYRGNHG
jgi:FkbM family methyltransferase